MYFAALAREASMNNFYKQAACVTSKCILVTAFGLGFNEVQEGKNAGDEC